MDFKANSHVKVSISQMNDAEYKKSESSEPDALIINEEEVYRVNVIGIVVNIGIQKITIEDGTGNIEVIYNNSNLDGVSVGSCIGVFGTFGYFNNQKYIIPRGIKKLNSSEWVKYRQKELEIYGVKKKEKKENKKYKYDVSDTESVKEVESKNKETPNSIEEKKNDISKEDKEKKDDVEAPIENIINTIRKLDNGDGAPMDDIISQSTVPDAEKLIKNMIAEGEIFEIMPGIIKILE